MDNHKFRQLIEGYLKGNLSKEDFELLQRWYASFGESDAKVPGLEDDRASQALQAELDARIQRVINAPATIAARTRKRLGWQQIAAAAAIIVALGGTFWYTERQYAASEIGMPAQHQALSEVRTGVRQVKRLVLPDGSIIHVNANSVIRISERMDGNQREVFLDEGEAYFEIARDTLRPFVVRAANLAVEVLGTAFNIKSYAVLDDITVAVSRGKVRVRDASRVLGEMLVNEGLTYNKLDGEVSLVQLNPTMTYSWIRGAIPLEKARFSELALALYNLYGVRLKSDDPRTVHHNYNLILRSDRSLDETMDVICSIHKTTYRRERNEITIYQ